MTVTNKIRVLAFTTGLVLLASCGGGGSGGDERESYRVLVPAVEGAPANVSTVTCDVFSFPLGAGLGTVSRDAFSGEYDTLHLPARLEPKYLKRLDQNTAEWTVRDADGNAASGARVVWVEFRALSDTYRLGRIYQGKEEEVGDTRVYTTLEYVYSNADLTIDGEFLNFDYAVTLDDLALRRGWNRVMSVETVGPGDVYSRTLSNGAPAGLQWTFATLPLVRGGSDKHMRR